MSYIVYHNTKISQKWHSDRILSLLDRECVVIDQDQIVFKILGGLSQAPEMSNPFFDTVRPRIFREII